MTRNSLRVHAQAICVLTLLNSQLCVRHGLARFKRKAAARCIKDKRKIITYNNKLEHFMIDHSALLNSDLVNVIHDSRLSCSLDMSFTIIFILCSTSSLIRC